MKFNYFFITLYEKEITRKKNIHIFRYFNLNFSILDFFVSIVSFKKKKPNHHIIYYIHIFHHIWNIFKKNSNFHKYNSSFILWNSFFLKKIFYLNLNLSLHLNSNIFLFKWFLSHFHLMTQNRLIYLTQFKD